MISADREFIKVIYELNFKLSDAVLLKYKSSGLPLVTKTVSTWLRNNITSEEKNSREQNEEENDDEYSDD